jgi:hypothetical protein
MAVASVPGYVILLDVVANTCYEQDYNKLVEGTGYPIAIR